MNPEPQPQKLYKTVYRGIIALFTEDAYNAYRKTLEHFRKYQSFAGVDPELEQRVIAGTLTFASYAVWKQGPLLYSGIHEQADAIQRVHDVELIDKKLPPLLVPFASGDPKENERHLRLGYGPNWLLYFDLLDRVQYFRRIQLADLRARLDQRCSRV
jgi:hypothetical protein